MDRDKVLSIIHESIEHAEGRGGWPPMEVLRALVDAGALRDPDAEAARDAALAEAAALREALERIVSEDPWQPSGGKCVPIADAALSTPPSAALADLRARVRDAALEKAAVKIETDGAKEAEERMHKAAAEGKDQLADGYAGAGAAAKYYARAIRAMKGQGDG